MDKGKSIISNNLDFPDLSGAVFYIFQVVLAFLLIFGVEPFKGQTINSFIISLLIICFAYPFSIILSFKYKKIAKNIQKEKSSLISLFLLLVFVIFAIYLSSTFLFSLKKSFLLFVLSFLQIAFFIWNDLIKNKGEQLVRTNIFLFIGVFFGWGIFNIMRVLGMLGLHIPMGNPIIGIWGLIFYSFNAIWLLDKKNIIVNFLYKKRGWLWILAGIMFIFIILLDTK